MYQVEKERLFHLDQAYNKAQRQIYHEKDSKSSRAKTSSKCMTNDSSLSLCYWMTHISLTAKNLLGQLKDDCCAAAKEDGDTG